MSEHDQLEPFFDGALPADEAAAFKRHLAGCASCADRLGELVYLQSLQHDNAAEAKKVVPIHGRRRAWKIAAVAAPLAVAAAAVLILRADRPPAPVVSLAGERLLEARLGWEPAERYRPFGAARGEDASEPGLVPVIDGLVQAGDHRGAAAAWLLAGAPERARRELAQAGRDADADATAAAILLVEGEPREALARADEVLKSSPRNPAARWNRALALRDLELPLSAAQAFAAVAELGEPGWADEAGKRREALLAPLREAQQRATPFTRADARLDRARQSLAEKDFAAALSEARAVRAEARSLGEYARESAALGLIAEILAGQDDALLAGLFRAEHAARANLP